MASAARMPVDYAADDDDEDAPLQAVQEEQQRKQEQQQRHAAARLQLAAALLEYDYDTEGKLAEESAIFAPYRQETAFSPGQQYSPASPGLSPREQGYAEEAEYAEQHVSPSESYPRPSFTSTLIPASLTAYIDPDTNAADDGYFQSATPGTERVWSPEPVQSPAPLVEQEDDGVDDADLASQWGLDTVVSKFETLDSNAFRTEASKISAARKGEKPKGRKRAGTASSDILSLGVPDLGNDQRAASLDGGLAAFADARIDEPEEELQLELDLQRASQSVPTDFASRRKLRHRSGSEVKAARKSLESELEMAFSVASDAGARTSSVGPARSRSSSLGTFDAMSRQAVDLEEPEDAEDEADQADFAGYSAPRPISSMSGYVSRFDPKAVAAQREEELASRPRFPDALHPKILVMPAPLADLEGDKQAEADAPEVEKPRPVREAGKLYGKSLMDELQQRKDRQRARNRAFKGDSRRAMMDMHKYRRASPLGGIGGEEEDAQEDDSDDEDDEDKPLRPATSPAHADNEPWIKYTSHRSLAAIAKSKSVADAAGLLRKSPTTPTLPTGPKSPAKSPGEAQTSTEGPTRRTYSTAELQQLYKKRQSTMSLAALANGTQVEDGETLDEEDEDDDVPLEMRKAQLAEPVVPNEQPSQKAPKEKKAKAKAAQTVFGTDLVMQRELAKLEQILEIEEAEKKIQAEKQRIKDAEREAKERKKQAKAAKKEKKKREKDKALGKVPKVKSPTPAIIEEDVDMQWRSEKRNTVMLRDNLLSPSRPGEFEGQLEGQVGQRGSYYSFNGMDNASAGRNSLLPKFGDGEDGALTPRGEPRQSMSFAPSLTLPFLPGDVPGQTDAGNDAWFGGGEAEKGSDDEGSDKEERVRSKSPFGLENFASDDEERVDPTAIWDQNDSEKQPTLRESYDPAKKPELQRMSIAGSLSGILGGFGFSGEGEGEDGDEADGHSRNRQSRRLSIHHEDEDSDNDEERRPLSSILLGQRNSQAFLSDDRANGGKLMLEPPRLDLPMDFALGAKDSSDSEEEDETPLALKRLNASLTAGAAGRTYDAEDDDVDDDSSEDDQPLAAKQDDDKPLGQAHPVAALSQQYELQQQQSMMIMAQMQMQYQYALQAQMQQAMLQQADIQGYSVSQLGYVAPAAAMSGAASDIGADLGPDPKLISSIDRWRQKTQS